MATTLAPILTSTLGNSPNYNTGLAETFFWVPAEGAGMPLYAKLVHPAQISEQLTTVIGLLSASVNK